MTQNELRIGNYVTRKDVDGLYEWEEADWVSMDEGSSCWEDFSPIPLTPKLLIKCRFNQGKVKGVTRFVDDFEDIDPTDKKKYTYYWDLSIPKNSHVDDLNTFSLVQFGKGADIFWKHQMLSVKIKSIHQLQNLFFALTGKELNIEP